MALKTKSIFLTALLILTALGLASQKPADLVGTWTGSAFMEGDPDGNDLTLVLEFAEDVLSGHMSDSYGVMAQSPIDEVKLAEGKLSFSVSAAGPDGSPVAVTFEMEVAGDAMEGSFTIADMGMSGTWKAERTK